MQSIFTWLSVTIYNILSKIIDILPDSPFNWLTQNSVVADYLGYINYFIPMSFILSTLENWLFAITIYYIFSLILRWVKAID